MKDKVILEFKDLCMDYPLYKGLVKKKVGEIHAVDHASLYVHKGETLGLVGESGCGKTSLGKCVVRLQKPTGGKITYHGNDGTEIDMLHVKSSQVLEMRRRIQMVFQDPYSAMDPSHTVLDAFEEPMKLYGYKDKEERRRIISELFKSVNLPPDYMYRYPTEFSGGQRQRICIARALCINPEVIVLDEPVSALDVSIQAQVLNLLKDLQAEKELTYIFIAHDLSVVEYMSDRIAVMYLGNIVELADSGKLYDDCRHPYTKALLSAVPIPVRHRDQSRIILQGDVPSPANPPTGCPFHPRCSRCTEKCRKEKPVLLPLKDDPEHFAACHFAECTES